MSKQVPYTLKDMWIKEYKRRSNKKNGTEKLTQKQFAGEISQRQVHGRCYFVSHKTFGDWLREEREDPGRYANAPEGQRRRRSSANAQGVGKKQQCCQGKSAGAKRGHEEWLVAQGLLAEAPPAAQQGRPKQSKPIIVKISEPAAELSPREDSFQVEAIPEPDANQTTHHTFIEGVNLRPGFRQAFPLKLGAFKTPQMGAQAKDASNMTGFPDEEAFHHDSLLEFGSDKNDFGINNDGVDSNDYDNIDGLLQQIEDTSLCTTTWNASQQRHSVSKPPIQIIAFRQGDIVDVVQDDGRCGELAGGGDPTTQAVANLITGQLSLEDNRSKSVASRRDVEDLLDGVASLALTNDLGIPSLPPIADPRIPLLPSIVVDYVDEERDKEDIYTYLYNDKKVMAKLTDGNTRSREFTEERVRHWQNLHKRNSSFFLWVVRDQHGKFLGIAVFEQSEEDANSAEISGALRSDCWDQKYAKAAMVPLMEKAEELYKKRVRLDNHHEFTRLMATCRPDNIASKKLLEGRGFTPYQDPATKYGSQRLFYHFKMPESLRMPHSN